MHLVANILCLYSCGLVSCAPYLAAISYPMLEIQASHCQPYVCRYAAQARMEVEAEKQGREDATAAVLKLQAVIGMVREEMEASQVAYARCEPS